MSEKKSSVDNVKLALSQAPLEIHSNIVFTVCRANISKIGSLCSRLATEDEFIQLPDNRQEVVDDIYFNLDEIKKILWAAVEVSNARNTKESLNSEG